MVILEMCFGQFQKKFRTVFIHYQPAGRIHLRRRAPGKFHAAKIREFVHLAQKFSPGKD